MPEDFRLQPLDPDDTKMKNPELVHTDGVVKTSFYNPFWWRVINIMSPKWDNHILADSVIDWSNIFWTAKKIWHHQDTTFNTPKVYLDIVIKNPAFISSPEGHVLTRIYAYLLNDYFAPYLYQDRHLFELKFQTLEHTLQVLINLIDHIYLDDKSRHY